MHIANAVHGGGGGMGSCKLSLTTAFFYKVINFDVGIDKILTWHKLTTATTIHTKNRISCHTGIPSEREKPDHTVGFSVFIIYNLTKIDAHPSRTTFFNIGRSE